MPRGRNNVDFVELFILTGEENEDAHLKRQEKGSSD